MIGIGVFIFAVIYCLWYLIKTVLWVNRAANMTANIVGPKPLPFIGNALMFLKASNTDDLFKILIDFMNEYSIHPDYISKIWFGPKLVISLGNPDHIKDSKGIVALSSRQHNVWFLPTYNYKHSKFEENRLSVNTSALLSSQNALQKDAIYEFLETFGSGVLVKNGREWQVLRKPLDKLLTKKMIDSNLEMFYSKAIKCCEVLNKYADTGKVFNVKHYVANFAVDCLSVSSFGYNMNALEKDKHDFAEVSERIIDRMMIHIITFPFYIGAKYACLRMRKYTKPLWDAANEMLEGRIANKKILGEEMEGKYTFYSDVLIEKATKDKLSLDETGRLAGDFLIAGYDTSTATMSHALLLLAMYPEHQKAVYQEQLDILGDDPEVVPTWEQLSEMKYLTRVLKEVMRLYSPPAILRNLTSDIDLGKFKFPEGATVYISFYNLHRNPNFWSHPNEFYPDHFLPEECAKRPKNCYFPFSWGPRSCPGSVYAMIVNKILISTVIRNYKLETHLTFEQLLYKYSLLLDVSHGYLMNIKRRFSPKT